MEQYNEDELVPPSWLDRDFIEMVLRKYKSNNTIVIENLKISPGTEKGDHFASIMFRVVATYKSPSITSESISMILKTIPEEEGFKKEVLDQMLYFETEIGMYAEEIPKLENVLRNNGDNVQFGSKILYHSLEPHKVIVFEDLVALGYTCIRDRYLNADEVKLCLSKIAKWHAASYKLLTTEGDISAKKYKEGLLSRPKNEQPEFITEGFKLLIEAISKIEEFEKYNERLRNIEPSLISKCNDIFNGNMSDGNCLIMVLNHGDLHNRNVMFKFDENNKVEDVMLVDMQISCYGPAVIDIFCSIQMLFDADLRQNHRDQMIRYYFSIFIDTLRNVKYTGKLPTLEDLYSDMIKCKEFELWLAVTLVPLICAIMSKGGNVQTEDLISSKEAQIQMYLNPDFIAELRGMLPTYFCEG
ncbi:uncharacterized protein LOC129918046 [Episyrphus balteatus]|uniref:uncharacterized protein LOC129918046 n=1 Tax=Episyrphus balteatus TaxID=286459 RepID=UPI00248622AC|nr:uncharacterized protein LOC129918046 [Episyrphus balteatus]